MGRRVLLLPHLHLLPGHERLNALADPEGPLPERPLLAPWLRRSEGPDGSLRLDYADEIAVVGGSAVTALVPLLDGTRTLAEIEAALGPGAEELVRTLAAERLVVAGPAAGDEEALREAALSGVAPTLAARRLAAARIDLVGESRAAAELGRLLPGRVRRLLWHEPPLGADLAVAAPSGAELPELRGWNERCLAAGTPWLLVLPFNGRFASVGPLFVPGETCCYECFVRRRASALPDSDELLALDLAPAPAPTGQSLAAALAGLAAAAAARWLARADAALPGAFFALELGDGLSLTRHRVLRVPRCAACSPAAETPPLLPWASR